MPANITDIEAFDSSKQQTAQNPSCWSRRTNLERKLCFITVVCLVLFCVMVLVLPISRYWYTENPNNAAANLCLTPGCVKTAAEILLNIDENVDPCTDFYQFACGGWPNWNFIPEGYVYIDTLGKLNEDFARKLIDLLEKKLDDSDPPYVRMIKDLYNMCMDQNAIDEAGAEPLKQILSTFGGWPVVAGNKWKENKFDWLESLTHFRTLGYDHNILFSLIVDLDKRNNTVHIIQLQAPKLILPDRDDWIESGLDDDTTAAYYKKMIESAKYLGADNATVEKELLEALHFEMALANFSALPDKDEGNVTRLYKKYTVKELQNMIPQIPWLKYFNSLLSDKIYENETLVVDAVEFLKNFADLVTTTEKRVIANYMMWRVVAESLPFLSKELRDIDFEYNKVLGETQEKPRSLQCLFNTFTIPWNLIGKSVTPPKIEIALSSYYFRLHFDEESYQLVLEIAEYIHDEFLDTLDEIKWMDETTKAHAKSKAKNMKYLLGYPKELLNDTVVTEFFKTLAITNDSYYRNIFKIKKWAIDYEFSQLQKPHVRGDWRNYADLTVNAFYDRNENIIQCLPGMLQKPYFNKDRPYYVNFGEIGAIIGHEITHGFTTAGKEYDKDGNLADWWELESDERFAQRAQCIIEQYSNYTIEIGMQIDGEQTETENIADNGGLKEAYLAYLSWVEDNEPEKLLPGLKYNQKQLFWISNAHGYCAKYTTKRFEYDLNAAYSPHKFRVIGPMSNLEEFAKDFNCPLNSPMNKQPKCQVW